MLSSFQKRRPLSALIACTALVASIHAAPRPEVELFAKNVQPILENYCYDCHGDGMSKGKVSFDTLTADEILLKRDLWFTALKNVRAGLMPPTGKPRPDAGELKTLETWIKFSAFGIDPANPDPGRVTVRRLNRVEYRNTIRDLLGVDFNSEVEFPPDDTGYGFDNIGDVLTVSPLLLEKYLQAAETLVESAVPRVSHVIRERNFSGREFRGEGANGDNLNVNKPAKVLRKFSLDQAEHYHLSVKLDVHGSFDFDPGRAQLTFTLDGKPLFTEEIGWQENKRLNHEFDPQLSAGEHVLACEMEPRPPANPTTTPPPRPNRPTPPPQSRAEPADVAAVPSSLVIPPTGPATTKVEVRIQGVQLRGPLSEKFWVAPENYARFFPRGPAPAAATARAAYAGDILRAFASRAFRRPVDEPKVAQLVDLARDVYTQPGKTFEEGVARAMMAVLASPRFLFRIEPPATNGPADGFSLIDEYALATRLSYFLWSTMPDDELFRLAAKGELRKNLPAQVQRMVKDVRALAFIKNFTGQWLQARDIENVPINARAVFGIPERRRGPRIEFTTDLRRAMREETERCFDYVLREDRSVLEFIDSDYAFLNAKLAAHYGVPGVEGDALRRVTLPPGSPRGGVLTQGTILTVTSNPTRTSPVKRGLFVLENILGTPPPPPPPDIPNLEASKNAFKGHDPTLREMLAVHRADKLCSSCHERMDPIGLAFENFNALGNWRDTENTQPIASAGKLVTGEEFGSIRELKHLLTHERRFDYYRCLTEKIFTYALGRGVDTYDLQTIDEIVGRLDATNGRFSELLNGIISSAAFQKQRNSSPPTRVTLAPAVSPASAFAAQPQIHP